MLQNLDWTKATVNGKKAGLVVFNGNIWLLSYCVAWNDDTYHDYASVPNHSFHKKTLISTDTNFDSFADWRNDFVELFPEWNIYLPGERGFERNIRRRANNSEEPQPAPQPDIDFYLPNYTHNNVYVGQNRYHASHSDGYMNTPREAYRGHRIGIELEVEATTTETHTEIIEKKSNWFTRERDGSLGSLGIEFITIPLLPGDAKSYSTWLPLVSFLKTRASSWNCLNRDRQPKCGLHVHVGREILGDNETERQMTLGKLLIFYQSEIERWANANNLFGRATCYNQPNGDTKELEAVKVLGKECLKEPSVFKKVDKAMKDRFGRDRYFAVNLQNTNTIEFRKGRGSINADRIIAIITFVESICLFCREESVERLTLDDFKRWLFLKVECGNPMFRYLNIADTDA